MREHGGKERTHPYPGRRHAWEAERRRKSAKLVPKTKGFSRYP